MNTQAGQRHKLARMQKWRDDGFSDLAIAAEFDLPVDTVRRLLNVTHGEPNLLRDYGRRLLKHPPTEVLNKTFGGDVEWYRSCVLANFPEAA